MKINLKVAIIVVIIITLLIFIICGGIYFKAKKDDVSAENQLESFIKESKTENNIMQKELNKVCTIKGKNSDLLYKNEYESDTSYLEKVIYSEGNNEKRKMNFSVGGGIVEKVLNSRELNGNVIKVKYDTDDSDYDNTCIYTIKKGFGTGKTNKVVKNGFDKNGEKVYFSIFDTIDTIKSKCTKFYVLFDTTNAYGEEYIIGMYNEIFKDNNPNVLQITVILRKHNNEIDISDKEQVKNFWDKYANYEIEETKESESNKGNYEEVNVDGEILYHILTNNLWKGEHHKEKFVIRNNFNKKETISYEDYIKFINDINSNASEKIEKIM